MDTIVMTNHTEERSLEILEWPVILERIKRHASTSTGKKFIENLEPLSPGKIKTQLNKISEIKEMMIQGNSLSLSGVRDIEQLLTRAKKNSILKIEELIEIRTFVIASQRVKKFLKGHNDELKSLNEEYSGLHDLKKIGELFISSITENNELSRTKYPVLKKIEDSIYSSKQEAEKILNKLIYSPSMEKVLQEKIVTTRNHRFVIPVKSNMKNRIKGSIHDLSSSGATAYIEPDSIRKQNNDIITNEIKLQEKIFKILKDLSEAAGEESGTLINNLEILTYLDFLNASSKFSRDINGSEPEILHRPEMMLYGARHPLLHLMMPDEIVSNDIELGVDHNCLIISGANTGGKTVLLKTAGLIAIMTKYGIHIPAGPDSRIGIYDKIFADIGDDQNLVQSLSSFSGQIVIIDDMLKNADKNSLVLIDEIIVGTNPAQGAAIAQSILEGLADSGCKMIVTTHYTALKELASMDERFCNASVSFDLDTLKPTYNLNVGVPGVSYAVEIASNYGLSKDILNRSKELIDKSDASVESLLSEIQKYREQLEEEKIHIKKLKEQLSSEKDKYNRSQKKLTETIEEIKKEQGVGFLKELKEYRKKVSERIFSLQQAGIKEAGTIQDEIIQLQKKLSKEMQESKEKDLSEHYKKLTVENAIPGATVFIPSIEKKGKIENMDSSGKRVTIILGNSIRTRYRLEELLISDNDTTPTIKKSFKKIKEKPLPEKSKNEKIPGTIQTSYNTVDLRGLKVDEAVYTMENNFDSMIRSGIEFAVVIHGHGTGALKEAIRENLKFSYYSAGFRPGDPGEGSDGVTIVKLNL